MGLVRSDGWWVGLTAAFLLANLRPIYSDEVSRSSANGGLTGLVEGLGETTIMFLSGVYFLLGDSSKVCVVSVLPGKNILNKLLEYSTFFPPKGNITPAGKKPEKMFSGGKGSRGPPILVHN